MSSSLIKPTTPTLISFSYSSSDDGDTYVITGSNVTVTTTTNETNTTLVYKSFDGENGSIIYSENDGFVISINNGMNITINNDNGINISGINNGSISVENLSGIKITGPNGTTISFSTLYGLDFNLNGALGGSVSISGSGKYVSIYSPNNNLKLDISFSRTGNGIEFTFSNLKQNTSYNINIDPINKIVNSKNA
jgi:hypothetical protein